MQKNKITRYQNRRKGLNVLKQRLGIRGFIQFMQDFGLNEGDYTKERKQWLTAKTVNEVVDDIMNVRS